MTLQRMLPFRSGRHVRFARHLGVLFGQARDLFWSDGPSCLVRRSYDSAELVRESPGCGQFGAPGCCFLPSIWSLEFPGERA